MTFGKREQMVVLFVGTALAIFLVHVLIFNPRSTEFARVKNEYEQGVAQLRDTEVLQSPKQLEDFKAKTLAYDAEITSLVAELQLDIPKHYASLKPEAVEKRMQDTLGYLRELVEMRARVKTPQLTFLDNRKPRGIQEAWNLPAQLPQAQRGGTGAIWDNVTKLRERFKFVERLAKPDEKLRVRAEYNRLLNELGLPPDEVSDWVVPYAGLGYIFFNDPKFKEYLDATLRQYNIQVLPNPYSLNRFGVLLPVFKRLWVSELIWEKRDPATEITKEELREILEIYPKFYPTDHGIVVTNKELAALVDIVKLAEKHSILEIYRVVMLKPSPLEKAVRRVPGATPTPEATPQGPPAGMPRQGGVLGFDIAMEPGMGPGMGPPGAMMARQAVATPDPSKQIGNAGGLEIYLRASNVNLVKFLFDLTHSPRTYAIDDLYIYADEKGDLNTSMTIELVTDLNALK